MFETDPFATDNDPQRTWAALKRLVDRAFELPPDERERFLDQQCGEDAVVRRYVESMLDLGATTIGVSPRTSPGRDTIPPHEQADRSAGQTIARPWEGRVLGPYRVLEELGKGGMGAVYAAERIDGEYEQRVAIKVVGRGPLTADLHRRFLLERQVLARLGHPGIARLLDGGTTDDGIPYLVLELIEGQPITDFCRGSELGLDALLALVIEVCRAVDFAHRNLVVHRDLKPGNILVQPDGRAKLLDFGIAKLLDEGEGELALTRADQRPGTLGYASPEQLLGEPVTTASDVYALGVLLYELLTHQRPFGETTDPWRAVAKVLQGEEPPKPSQALRATTSDRAGAAEAADGDGMATRLHSSPISGLKRVLGLDDDPPEVRALRGDLDRIVMRAIARAPEDRYGSAAELADDLERFRRHQPISVAPASFGYLAGKFVQRRRGTVLAAGLLLLTLVGGLVARSFEARRANLERARAEAARAEAEDLAGFMVQDLWQGLEPIGRLDLLGPVAEKLLEYYEQRAEDGSESAEHRESHLAALEAVGSVLLDAGRSGEAVAIFEQHLELASRSAETLEAAEGIEGATADALRQARVNELGSYPLLGTAQREAGRRDKALETLQEGVRRAEQWLRDHPGDTEIILFQASVLDDQGIVLYDQGRLDEAAAAFRRAAALLADAPPDPQWQASLDQLRSAVGLHFGVTEMDSGRLDSALGYLEEASRFSEQTWRLHTDSFDALAGWAFTDVTLSTALAKAGRPLEALDLLERLLPALRQAVARDPGNAEKRFQLANALAELGAARQAAENDDWPAAFAETIEVAEPLAATTDHIYLLDTHVRALLALGEVERARPFALQLLERDWDQRGFRRLCAENGIVASEKSTP